MSGVIEFVVAGRPLVRTRTHAQRKSVRSWWAGVASAAQVAHGRPAPLRGPVSVSVVVSYRRSGSTPPAVVWRSDRDRVAFDELLPRLLGALQSGAVIGAGCQVASVSLESRWAPPGADDSVEFTVGPLFNQGGPVGSPRAIDAAEVES